MVTKKGKAKPRGRTEQLRHNLKKVPKEDHYVILIHISTNSPAGLPKEKRIRLDWPYALVHKLTLKESYKTPWEADRDG